MVACQWIVLEGWRLQRTVHGTVDAGRGLGRASVGLQQISADGVQHDDALGLCKLCQVRGDGTPRAGVLRHRHAAARAHNRAVQRRLQVLRRCTRMPSCAGRTPHISTHP